MLLHRIYKNRCKSGYYNNSEHLHRLITTLDLDNPVDPGSLSGGDHSSQTIQPTFS